jgi:hypothetical protein
MDNSGLRSAVILFIIALIFLICAETTSAITEHIFSPYGTFAGSGAGAANTADGLYNSFFGFHAGNVNDEGDYNTFFGSGAGTSNTSGSHNTFFGSGAGHDNISGNNNTDVGGNSGESNETGNNNTFIGNYTGMANAGSGNVFIGYMAAYDEYYISQKLYIQNSDMSEPLIYGEFDNKLLLISGKLVFSSGRRLKKDIEPLKASLDKVLQLKGVTFRWKAGEDRGKGKNIGFIAQDVEKVAPELVYTVAEGHKSLSYDRFLPLLVEAIKEQQALIREQKESLATKSLVSERQQKELDEQDGIIRDLAEQLVSIKAEAQRLKSGDMTAWK